MAFAIHLRYPGLPITYPKISPLASAISKKTAPGLSGIRATNEVMDGPRQIIKQEALNAIYSKKALLALMVTWG